MPSAGRKLAIGSNVALSLLLGLALAVTVNVVAARRHRIWDWTATGEFSLSDKTRNVLSNLKEPVEIAAFYLNPRDPLDKQMRSLLRRYEADGHGKLIVHFAETDGELEDLKMKGFPIPSPKDRELRIAARCVGRIEKVPDRKLGTRRETTPYGPMGEHKFTGEAAVTYAIRAVSEAVRKNVGFVVGHGEQGLMQLKKLKEALEQENLSPVELELAKQTPTPESHPVLVVAGPQTPWPGEDLAKLSGYLKAGGRALILLEPYEKDDDKGTKPTGLEKALEEWGVRVGDEIVLDFVNNMDGRLPVLQFLVGRQRMMGMQMQAMAGIHPAHPVTESLARATMAPLLFPTMRPVELVNKPEGRDPQDVPDEVEILKSSEEALAYYDFKCDSIEKIRASPTTRQGPFSLAVAVTKKKGGSPEAAQGERQTRLAVYGDVDFVSDPILEKFPLNMDLALNSVNWLADREESLGIAAKTEVENLQIRLNPEARKWINWTCYLFAPGGILLLGLGVWFIRKS